MKYLKRLQRRETSIGGAGRFQVDDYWRQNVSPRFADMLSAESSASGPPTTVLSDAPASGCHANSMTFVMSIDGELWSGFALNDDVWRVHSWVVKDAVVVEATPVARERYVGIAINTAERFAAGFPRTAEDWGSPR